ncbi:MAG: response regulator transcription factor [Clostridia bacterium]|nr:response regulator transcription factor [Clostridia bacterium]
MIYYVEDDGGIRQLVVYTLNNSGFEAVGFEDGAGLFAALKEEKPELILLDLMLPGEDGISILKRLRGDGQTSDVPVIILTAKNGEYDKVVGLDQGADDYVTKPFGMMELLSRIRAVLRRSGAGSVAASSKIRIGGILLDDEAHEVFVLEKRVDLTLKEYQLLKLLMENKNKVLTRDIILEKVWGYNFDGETRTADVHVRTLRAKLGQEGNLIETVRGVGYRIGETV